MRRTFATTLSLAALGVSALPSEAAALASHRASYELRLKGQSDELTGADGRIALEVSRPDCKAYKLDYRFVARFQQEQELTVTDQRTTSVESLDGKTFSFETKTFIDSAADNEVRGTATTAGSQTVVALAEPETRQITIPAALFPMQHTGQLIEKAKAGQRIVETAIFDGDEDADKRLTSTAVISARSAPAAAPGAVPAVVEKLKGLGAWRVSESFYNSDSDPDGMPIFETAYTLYENGVSDDLLLVFDGYTFEGDLATLDMLDSPACP
ncbi:DUF1849 family protein [Aurantimonas sp. Leaf443]|uniref:EipB family protein n=1 Tax=Aurantimonas sp. Leaf443 TaxID=1736378 RepID=UPI0006F368AD|nr:DUF1849 family protein [Aurantimonas sp. Leaf443]KQT83436.1 hypothetical protein ASG48_12820 [Aurantimonas sp. Leaf443]